MLRIPGKAQKIAERILGKPTDDSKKKRKKRDSETEKRLNFENTTRTR